MQHTEIWADPRKVGETPKKMAETPRIAVKKLMVGTNISGFNLKNSGYKFHYTFDEAIADWFNDCSKEGLY